MQMHRKELPPEKKEQEKKKRRLGRDALFLTLGTLTWVNEVLLTEGNRLYIILGALTLMGFPVVSTLDQLRRRD